MSTPIETNTEDLREILQAVYELKNSGGGSSKPDLVIGAYLDATAENAPSYASLCYTTAEEFSIVSGSVDAVVEKVKQGLPVKVLLNTLQWYDTKEWYRVVAEATSVGLQNFNSYPSDDYEYLIVLFSSLDLGFRNNPAAVRININLETGEIGCSNKWFTVG